jgi:hypothetical protein
MARVAGKISIVGLARQPEEERQTEGGVIRRPRRAGMGMLSEPGIFFLPNKAHHCLGRRWPDNEGRQVSAHDAGGACYVVGSPRHVVQYSRTVYMTLVLISGCLLKGKSL